MFFKILVIVLSNVALWIFSVLFYLVGIVPWINSPSDSTALYILSVITFIFVCRASFRLSKEIKSFKQIKMVHSTRGERQLKQVVKKPTNKRDDYRETTGYEMLYREAYVAGYTKATNKLRKYRDELARKEKSLYQSVDEYADKVARQKRAEIEFEFEFLNDNKKASN